MRPVKVRREKSFRLLRPAPVPSPELDQCTESSQTRTQTRAEIRSKFPAAWMYSANGRHDSASERASGQKTQSSTATESEPRRDERKADRDRAAKQFQARRAASRE